MADGYELDDDRGRINRAVLHRYLSEESYWAHGRPRETLDMLIAATPSAVRGAF